jgi:hypothetical protein
VDPQVLISLGLTPTGNIGIVTPSTGAGVHPIDTYDVDFLIGAAPGEVPLIVTNLSVGACELFHAQGIHALIGRDILARCTVFYNGALSQFTISF